MRHKPLRKSPSNVPCKLISNYIPPTAKKHEEVIAQMRNKMLKNSSMVAKVVIRRPKKSLVRYEIGGKGKQDIKKLVIREEIGGHLKDNYGGRYKEVII